MIFRIATLTAVSLPARFVNKNSNKSITFKEKLLMNINGG